IATQISYHMRTRFGHDFNRKARNPPSRPMQFAQADEEEPTGDLEQAMQTDSHRPTRAAMGNELTLESLEDNI
ncbi:MAG: hypothetical protein PHS55_06800, partial [Firmicutes bacterium]|nr:hypothetical protein [Bacillota bacterium]